MNEPLEFDMRKLLLEARDAAKKKDFDRASDLLEKILETEPYNLKAMELIGFVRFFQGRFLECEQINRKAYDLQPNRAYTLSGLAMALARQGKLDEGLPFFEKAIKANPAWAEPYWDMAVVLRDAGRINEAIVALERGIKAVPAQKARFESFLSKLRTSQVVCSCDHR